MPRAIPKGERDSVRLPRSVDLGSGSVPFNDALAQSGTAAWLVLRDGKLIDERYFAATTADTLLPVFSVTKSIVGTLAAISQRRGEIEDFGSLVAAELPELIRSDKRCATLSWRRLMDMRSGARFSEAYDRETSDVARLYLADDLQKVSDNVPCEMPNSNAFRYASIDTQWLGQALESRVGMALDRQLQERVWGPMGAESAATWSTDNRGSIKAFCCLNLRARDLARFGQLILDRGIRDGSEIVPTRWIDELLERARRGEPYAGQWWLLRTARGNSGALLAEGILGQFLVVDPASRLVIVRIGERQGSLPWREMFAAISSANAQETP